MKYLLLTLMLLYSNLHGQLYFPPMNGDAWETLSPQSLGWKTNKLDELKQYLIDNDSKSFIILKDGKIVVEYYMNGHDASKSWYWASAGKSLTSVLVGFAEAEGKLNLQEPSSKYLGKSWSSLTESQESEIKVWHHITMTTGLDENVSFDCTDKNCLQYKAKPGTRWAYHNSPYTIIDNILIGATGQNLNLYFKNKLGDAIGMAGLFIKNDNNNIFYSTTRSMARFGLFCLAKGKWSGKQILNNPNYISSMVKPSQTLNSAYGYLFWLNGQSNYMIPGFQASLPGFLVPSAPASMFAALGKNEQRIYIIPEQNIVVIRMGDRTGGGGANVSIKFDNDLWLRLSDIMNFTTSTKNFSNLSKEKIAYYYKGNILIDNSIEAASVDIFDYSGILINSSKSLNILNIENQKRGVYFLKITDRNGKIYLNKIYKY